MSLRSRVLLPVVAGLACAGLATADELIVSAPSGLLYRADTATGVFQPMTCSMAFEQLAADETRLFGLDAVENIAVLDLAAGFMLNFFPPTAGTPNSIAAGPEGLFVGTTEGHVLRLDPSDGSVLQDRTTPDGVRRLLVHRGKVYVASTNGAIYRADATGGDFDYFSCFCFFNIQMLRTDRGHLVIADEFSTVARIDLATGQVVAAFSLFGSEIAEVHEGRLLLYYDGGVIPFASAWTGQILGGQWQAPEQVSAMLVVRERGRPTAAPRSGSGLKMP